MTTIDDLTKQLQALDSEEAQLEADEDYVAAKRRRAELFAMRSTGPLSSRNVTELDEVRGRVVGFEAEIARNRRSLHARREAIKQQIAVVNIAEWPRDSSKDRKELAKAVAKALELALAMDAKRISRERRSGVPVYDVALVEAMTKLEHVQTALQVEPSGAPDRDRSRIGSLRITAVNGV